MADDREDIREELKPVEIAGFGRVEDSRLKGYNGLVTHPSLPLERTYCCKCSKPFGWVSAESYGYIRAGEVVVFCNECEAEINKVGPIPLAVAGDENTTEFKKPQGGTRGAD